MQATQVLRNEHEGIMAMLAVVEAAAYRLREGKQVSPELFTDAVDFFRNFADGCHHSKEELELFPELVEHGIPQEGGPVGMMLIEHDQGRAFIRAMKEAAEAYARGDQSAIPALTTNALEYVELLRQHIQKENNVLFVMADQVLGDSEQSRLYDAFEEIERTRTGPGEHERYHAMIAKYQKVAAEWGRVPV